MTDEEIVTFTNMMYLKAQKKREKLALNYVEVKNYAAKRCLTFFWVKYCSI